MLSQTPDVTALRPLPESATAVVVGAGYAGLSAALELSENGVDVAVVEASGRVGGRVLSEPHSEAGVLDHGGQWIGPTQRSLLAWAERFGCGRFDTWDTGAHIDAWADGSQRRAGSDDRLDAPGMEEYADLAARLNKLAATIDLEEPAASPEADWLDSQTVASWLDHEVADPDTRRRFALSVQGVWSVEPRDLSMLHLLFYIASAGSYEQLMETRDCAQAQRFLQGAQAPAVAAAAELGDAVNLHAPVLRIASQEKHRGYHELTTARGSIRAEVVVVAVPPPAVRHIEFTPMLPAARRRWLERSVMGDVAKVHVVYDTPFWRKGGDSGQASLFTDEPVGVVFDNSPVDGSCGVLVAFVYGDRLRRWSDQPHAARRSQVLDALRRLFGPAAAQPRDYLEKNWVEEPYIAGGYAAVPAPGAWVEHGRRGWREPVGTIHWAGTETASMWHGYIDGAISSGERAAHEVLAALRR